MTVTVGHDSAKTRKTLSAGGKSVAYYSIPAAQEAGLGDFSKLPAALKVVLENMLRFEDGKTVHVDDICAFAEWATDDNLALAHQGMREARAGPFHHLDIKAIAQGAECFNTIKEWFDA